MKDSISYPEVLSPLRLIRDSAKGALLIGGQIENFFQPTKDLMPKHLTSAILKPKKIVDHMLNEVIEKTKSEISLGKATAVIIDGNKSRVSIENLCSVLIFAFDYQNKLIEDSNHIYSELLTCRAVSDWSRSCQTTGAAAAASLFISLSKTIRKFEILPNAKVNGILGLSERVIIFSSLLWIFSDREKSFTDEINLLEISFQFCTAASDEIESAHLDLEKLTLMFNNFRHCL